jgi:hypothetical protein
MCAIQSWQQPQLASFQTSTAVALGALRPQGAAGHGGHAGGGPAQGMAAR